MRLSKSSFSTILIVLAFAGNTLGQSAPAPTGKEAINSLLNQKEKYLKKEIGLSDLAHDVFIAEYLKYVEEVLLLDDSREQYQNSLVRSAEFGTEEELLILSGGLLEIERQKIELKQRFYDYLVNQFGVTRATLWLRAEIEFQKELLRLYSKTNI